MLLKYGVRNCLCFRERMEIDLRLNDNVPSDMSRGLPAATAMCFMGANASGKTCGLKVLSFIVSFALESFMNDPDGGMKLDTFFHSDEPAEFFIVTLSDNATYTYEFCVTGKGILGEKISRRYRRAGSKETAVFHRVGNEIMSNTLYRGHTDIRLRSNASIISTLRQYGIGEISDLCGTMSHVYMNVPYAGTDDRGMAGYGSVSEKLSDDPVRLERVCSILRGCGTGIESISIRKIRDEYGRLSYYPVFFHGREGKEPFPMQFDAESKGTQKLFIQLYYYLETLETGGVLLLDDIETCLHPDLFPYLIGTFTQEKNNGKHAQMICTTRNTEIMDMMGRYRTYIFEKTDGESICFRVDDAGLRSLRNDRPISVPYRKKMLGGVPLIKL